VRLAALLIGVCLAALGGCGGSDDSGNGDFKQHEASAAGFAVSVPSSWKTIDDLDGDAVEEFSRENPDFAQFLQAASANRAIKFIALDPEVRDEFSTNLNVIVLPIPGSLTFEQWVTANLNQVKQIGSARITSRSTTELPAGQAERLVWTYDLNRAGRSKPVAVDQYLLRREEQGFVLTFTTLPAHTGHYRDTFARSARSFEFR
jgi:hypothetical protein